MSQASRDFYKKLKSDPAKFEIYLKKRRISERARTWEKSKLKESRVKQAARKKLWRQANPERVRAYRKAHAAVAYALRVGRLVRPSACSKCGKTGEIEAHHPSYETDQVLVVAWLCVDCHTLEHFPLQH